MKPVILAICGKSATGKDSLADFLSSCELGITKIISDTTRPKRPLEKEGVDYHYISIEEFADKVEAGQYLEWSEFRNWYYGTPLDAVCGKINVGVFNMDGIAELYRLQKEGEYEVIPIYIKSRTISRFNRYRQREGRFSLECLRRFITDTLDFQNVSVWLSLFPQHIVLKNFSDIENLYEKAQYLVREVLSDYYQ